MPKRSTADAMTAIFDVAPRAAASVGNNAGLPDVEEEEDGYVEWNYPQVVPTNARDGGEEGDDIENPWYGYDARRWEPPTKVNIKGGEEWMCPEHGATCNPGICKVRGDVESRRRREKEHEERLEAIKKGKERRRRAEEKRERKLDREEGREVSHDLPPNFRSYRYKGAGGSGSGSDSGSDSISGACAVYADAG